MTAEYNFDKPALVPEPLKAEWKLDRAVTLNDGFELRLSCGEGEAAPWLERHVREAFGLGCRIVALPVNAALDNPEAYTLSLSGNAVEIAAKGLVGVRFAFYTLRQILTPARGTMTVSGWIGPEVEIEDRPAMKFRGMHLCWFPETRVKLIERAIRLSAYYKFTTVVIETWGVFRSEKYPWYGWENGIMTKTEIRRLVAIAADLGVTLVPQLNIFGHASASRSSSGKHAVLDVHPEFQPLFEPNAGWNWCLSNPAAHEVIDNLVVELHEAFGNPPFFHIGCDEAMPPSCPVCRAQDYVGLIGANIAEVTDILRKRGARSMMWHDMLLKKGEWGRFYANATIGEERLLETLPRDIVICDWFYNEGVSPEGYPTFAHFQNAGFDVVSSPWQSVAGTEAQGKAAREIGMFGILGTTWHHLYKRSMDRMFIPCAAAAWGDGKANFSAYPDHLRQMGWDTGVTDYRDCGYTTGQIPFETSPEIYPHL